MRSYPAGFWRLGVRERVSNQHAAQPRKHDSSVGWHSYPVIKGSNRLLSDLQHVSEPKLV